MHVEVEAKDSGAKVLEETCSYVRRLQRVMGVTVEKLHSAGLTKGGSTNNAAVFSTSTCLLNPPLRSPEEPCRHKMLDFIGDVSLFACNGSQGLPVANIIAYKVDQSIVESFAQGGRTVITSRVYPTKAIYTASKVFLFNNATGVSIIANVNVWNMDSAQIEYFPLGQQ